MTIRILLVDDHPLVVHGLQSALANETDLQITAVATTLSAARTALEADADAAVDVVVCDIRLPDGSGFELLKGSRVPGGPAFVMLSSFDAPQYISAAVRLGASGFLLKSAPWETIASAIREVHRGGVRFESSPDLIAHARRAPILSTRDRDLIRAVIDGRSNDEIAAELHIARKTVEAHLSKLYARTGVATRTELAVAAERGGWLDVT